MTDLCIGDPFEELRDAVRGLVPADCRVYLGREDDAFWARVTVVAPQLESGTRASTIRGLQRALLSQVIPDLNRDITMLRRAHPLVELEQVDVVLEPFVAAVAVHECVGHSSEADNFQEYGGVLGLRLGDRWTHQPLSVVDDPTVPGHNGSYAFDDEGTAATRVDLVRRGVWTGLLTSKNSGGRPSNGHGRSARDGSGVALPRMAHLSVGAGVTATSSMTSALSGFLLGGTDGGGSVRDLVVIRPLWAQRYEDGEPGEVVRNLEIRARKAQLMRRLSAIGDEVVTFDPYHPCSKNGQDVPITMSAPRVALCGVRLYPRRDASDAGRL